jgi:pimeloyl-ACP methyl ester carboxylesterase
MTLEQGKVPLVLLPGSLCNKDMWQPQVDALADIADTRVVETASCDSINEMAAHVLREVPDERFALAGFSLGGFIALEILRQAPQRVSRLALLDTSARPDNPDNAPRRLANIEALKADPQPVLDLFVDLTRGSTTPAEVVEQVRASMYRMGPGHYANQQRAMMGRRDARAALELVSCPVLVLCGSEDRATPPEHHREIAAAIPHAKYVELEGVGHMTPLEAPAQVNAALRTWLQGDAHNDQSKEAA